MKFSVKKSKLNGVVQLSGAKNSALRLLAASLLTNDSVHLSNYPKNLQDIVLHEAMLEKLGKKIVHLGKDEICIIQKKETVNELVWTERSIRNTLLILGALVAKTGLGKVPLPGGCKLGDRKFDLHVMLLEKLGCSVTQEGEYLVAEAKGKLRGCDINLPIKSTGATENSIICGTLAEGKTTVWNPHIRPEIIDLITLLKKMGAKITVFGQERIEIEGVDGLMGCDHSVISDNMEALTWFIASTITDGDIEIVDFPFEHLEVPLIFLRESGAKFYKGGENLIVRGGECFPVDISTGPYPGINSDMQPLFAVYGANSHGTTKIVDLRFPGRYGYIAELEKMGVNYTIDGNLLIIQGGNKLKGAEVTALDLRAGASLFLAGLIADGETIIDEAWQIERGYNNFIEKAISLECNISVV